MSSADFEVEVTEAEALSFAKLSGDWNPLHTDPAYAAQTGYRRPILHGAFSAGLFSRMAGMHIPGRDCLLHGMRLRFVSPIIPPVRLRVRGQLVRDSSEAGMVDVVVSDAVTSARYVEGSYEFSRHYAGVKATPKPAPAAAVEAPVLVTGASGGLGQAMLARLGSKGLGLSRSGSASAITVTDMADVPKLLDGRRVSGIVHCGWPAPDNQPLVTLAAGAEPAVTHHVAAPLVQIIHLARLLSTHGVPGATLVLVGSTAAKPGRHNYRQPLYSLAKGMVPTLAQVLAIELGAKGGRCVGVVFDVIAGPGMNASIREAVRQSHADRSPYGMLATPEEAADQIAWILDNSSNLISGAVVTLSGGSVP